MRISLFGNLRISFAGRPVTTVNTNRLQSLIAYLVLHGDVTQVTQHSESTLAAVPAVAPVVASSVNSSLRIPWVTATSSHPGVYHLETDVSVGRAASTASSPASTQDEVLVWMPLKSITLRVSDATQQVAPPTTISGAPSGFSLPAGWRTERSAPVQK